VAPGPLLGAILPAFAAGEHIGKGLVQVLLRVAAKLAIAIFTTTNDNER
jgi:hypothetical protein